MPHSPTTEPSSATSDRVQEGAVHEHRGQPPTCPGRRVTGSATAARNRRAAAVELGNTSAPGGLPRRSHPGGGVVLLSAALDNAERGFHVFPLHPGTKVPAIRQWDGAATRDHSRIRAWWRRRPCDNVAVACGPSGLHVLDLDTSHGHTPPPEWRAARDGREVLVRLAAEAGQPMPVPTYAVATPSVINGWYGVSHRRHQRRYPTCQWLGESLLSGVVKQRRSTPSTDGREDPPCEIPLCFARLWLLRAVVGASSR
ncbi:bifunctional DNA primase/polymerase [Nocardia amamiensis]|uniref:bifunctional DNA primase/polymerase n=1 Tax=Nocardia amamiensis TaxID=404578 RepID=UPI000A062DEE